MPMVGMDSAAETSAAKASGTSSSTTANAPASSTALSVGHDLRGSGLTLALLADSEQMDALGREADMSHDRNAGVYYAPDCRGDGDAAFELNSLGFALLKQPSGVPHGVFWR